MINKNLLISIVIFSSLLFLTSIIKNETRLLEKDIKKNEIKISNIEKDLFENQLEFYYLSTPKNLSQQMKLLSDEKYFHMNYSDIYLSFESFLGQQKKLSKK